MKRDELVVNKKYLYWAIAFILVIISYFIIRPFIIALISAFILAYLIRPVYKRFNTTLNKNISAALCILLVILILLVPAGLVLGEVVRQLNTYARSGYLAGLLAQLDALPILETLKINGLVSQASTLVFDVVTTNVYSIPSIIVSVFITLFGMYYILIDWEKSTTNLKKFLPFKNKKEIADEIAKITNILVYGTLFIAILEFFVAAVGFYLLGIKFYILLASLVFFFAFIPAMGPTLVWIPTAIYFFITKDYLRFAGTIVIGAILSGVIDSSFRAKLLGGRAKINPLIMLVGIFGGVITFGIFGFIIGPLILSYTIKILKEVLNN